MATQCAAMQCHQTIILNPAQYLYIQGRWKHSEHRMKVFGYNGHCSITDNLFMGVAVGVVDQ